MNKFCQYKISLLWVTGFILLAFCFFLLLFLGSVNIPAGEVWGALSGQTLNLPFVNTIVWHTRMPMAIASAASGAMLSVAGLVMQTLFHNPLAGPSVLGISSGSSFGVAAVMLSASGLSTYFPSLSWLLPMAGALAGGFITIGVLYLFSTFLRSALSLLIVGLMLSYLFSSGISLLNYFSPADEIRSYLVWGLGSFSGLRLDSSLWYLVITLIVTGYSLFFIKPLNALLIGEKYAESVGYSSVRLRSSLLIIAGICVAVPTAFCGPIGFIGLVVPHLCRLTFQTSNHRILLPACILGGAILAMGCALICVVPARYYGILPINVVTPIIGVPVILYIVLNRKKRLF